MITTRFLDQHEYARFGEWMKLQDPETLDTYFGLPVTDTYIDSLVERIVANPSEHDFLIAENKGEWNAVLHIAHVGKDAIEFGISVARGLRGHGIGHWLMSEGIVWARNRGYQTLYLHCLTRNRPIQRLCAKNGLKVFNEMGDAEVASQLPPASIITISQEVALKQCNVFILALQHVLKPLDYLLSQGEKHELD